MSEKSVFSLIFHKKVKNLITVKKFCRISKEIMKKFGKIISTTLFILILLSAGGIYTMKTNGDKVLTFYADKLFDDKEFEKAYSVYDTINCSYPENAYSQTKMVECLSKMPLTYSVQKKLLEFAQKDDGSEAEKLATKIVLIVREKVYKKYGDTYLNSALNNDMVIRWSKKSSPLPYYIHCEKNTPSYFVEQTESAFSDWTRETDELVKFVRVNNPIKAKILINFQGQPENGDGEYHTAITSPVIENEKVLKQMKINAFVKTNKGEYLSKNQVKTIITHEIGHSLGFWGHPKDNKSVMYYSLNNTYDFYERRVDTPISGKDVETIKLLYALAPDVCDNVEELEKQERFIYPKMLTSPVDNDREKMIERAKTMLEEHPEDIGSALSLADAYNENGKYKESIELMLFLTEHNFDKNLQSILFYNISNCYISLKDFDKAFYYAKEAQNCVNSVDNRCLIAYIKFCKNDLDGAEKDYYEILEKTPNCKNAVLGLADIYIKKKQYMKAREILKYILKQYPEFKNEKVFNPYKIYVLF